MAGEYRMGLKVARAVAEELIEDLTPACERIEIAGSIRRGRPDVGDIELVVIPKFGTFAGPQSLFGDAEPEPTKINWLEDHCLEMRERGIFLDRRDKHGKASWGPRFKRLIFHSVPLDLFAVLPPAQWGCLFTIRTGPADFSKRLVTSTRFGGLMPAWLHVQDGALRHIDGGEIVPTPEEIDFFAALGVPFIEPGLRV